MNSSIDILKRFMQFPTVASVQENFQKPNSTVVGYNDLKAYVDTLGAPYLPEITGFVFADDDKKVAKRIKDMQSFYIYFEAEAISNRGRNQMNVQGYSWRFSIFVLHKVDDRYDDNGEQALLKDRCLYLLRQMVKQIRIDDRALECPEERMLNNGYSFSPVAPFEHFQASGWVMEFTHEFSVLYDE